MMTAFAQAVGAIARHYERVGTSVGTRLTAKDIQTEAERLLRKNASG